MLTTKLKQVCSEDTEYVISYLWIKKNNKIFQNVLFPNKQNSKIFIIIAAIIILQIFGKINLIRKYRHD